MALNAAPTFLPFSKQAFLIGKWELRLRRGRERRAVWGGAWLIHRGASRLPWEDKTSAMRRSVTVIKGNGDTGTLFNLIIWLLLIIINYLLRLDSRESCTIRKTHV